MSISLHIDRYTYASSFDDDKRIFSANSIEHQFGERGEVYIVFAVRRYLSGIFYDYFYFTNEIKVNLCELLWSERKIEIHFWKFFNNLFELIKLNWLG
jgi:hypothetical protein